MEGVAGIKFIGCRVNALSCRVEIALKLKGVEYEYVEDPNAPMPLLLHNGKTIADSGIILEYIEENWKLAHPLLPQDLYDRASARYTCKFIDTVVIPTIWKAFRSKGQEQGEAMQLVFMQLKELEQTLQSNKFFGGNSIGLADITANFIGYWVGIIQQVTGLPLLTKAKYPKLSQWCDDFVTSPIVKDMLPPKHQLVAFLQSMFQAPPQTASMYQ